MFITRQALSRRTMLRGMGATVALPFLEAMLVPGDAPLLQGRKPVRSDRDGDGARRRRQHRLRHQEEHVVACSNGIGV